MHKFRTRLKYFPHQLFGHLISRWHTCRVRWLNIASQICEGGGSRKLEGGRESERKRPSSRPSRDVVRTTQLTAHQRWLSSSHALRQAGGTSWREVYVQLEYWSNLAILVSITPPPPPCPPPHSSPHLNEIKCYMIKVHFLCVMFHCNSLTLSFSLVEPKDSH